MRIGSPMQLDHVKYAFIRRALLVVRVRML